MCWDGFTFVSRGGVFGMEKPGSLGGRGRKMVVRGAAGMDRGDGAGLHLPFSLFHPPGCLKTLLHPSWWLLVPGGRRACSFVASVTGGLARSHNP